MGFTDLTSVSRYDKHYRKKQQKLDVFKYSDINYQMNFKEIFKILDTIQQWNHISTLTPTKGIIYNVFENSKKNSEGSPFYNHDYKLIKLMIYRGYINGKEVMDSGSDVTVGSVMAGVPHNKLEVIDLTEKGIKLQKTRSKFRWYADGIQSFLKEYDEINKIVLQIIAILCTAIISFCSGAVMVWILTHFLGK